MDHNDPRLLPVRRKGRFLMWSRSVLRVAQTAAVATVLLVSAAACGSTAKSRAAGAAAPATTTSRPTPTSISLRLGCGPNVRPASSVIWTGPAQHDVALTFDHCP